MTRLSKAAERYQDNNDNSNPYKKLRFPPRRREVNILNKITPIRWKFASRAADKKIYNTILYADSQVFSTVLNYQAYVSQSSNIQWDARFIKTWKNLLHIERRSGYNNATINGNIRFFVKHQRTFSADFVTS